MKKGLLVLGIVMLANLFVVGGVSLSDTQLPHHKAGVAVPSTAPQGGCFTDSQCPTNGCCTYGGYGEGICC